MIRFLARGLLFSFMALLLASCESGNDSVDVPGLSAFTLSIQTVNATTGLPATQATAAAPLRVVATLTSPAGAPVSGATVAFSASGVGRLGTTTAQTDGAGLASVILNAGTSSSPGTPSAGVVAARFVDQDMNVASDSQNYTTLGDENTSGGGGGGPTPTNVLRMTLSAIDGAGNPISSTNPINTANPGRLVVVVTLDGAPVSNAFVTFTAPNVATLSQTSAATNASGTAEVTVNAIANGAGVASAAATVGTQQVSASAVISTAVTATAPVTLKLGSLNGGTFTNSVLTSSAVGSIAAGSTISIGADVVVDPANTLYDTPVTLEFTSSCASLASPQAVIDSSAATVGGHATVTYRPISCPGNDTITATLRDGSRTLTATVTVNILPPVIAQVAFVSATPQNIALAGTGGLGRLTRSEVLFRVLGDTGSPIANQLVCFSLSTSVGGLSVNANARSNAQGDAIAAVQAGSIPTSVRVQATVDSDGDSNCATVPNPAHTAVSDALSVSTGLPDQNSLSLSFSTLNPLGWETDGTAVTVTARSADHFNNPVPDGTAIGFWAELGSIQPSCTTVDGSCSVIWRSQAPRSNRDPRGGATIGINDTVGRAINDRYGRATIMAYAVGEESFNDADGDGRFDDVNGNGVYDFGTDETIGNLAEAIKDSNENGVRDRPGLSFDVFEDEEFVDFDGDGVNDPANTRYDGVLCASVTTACSADATVNVRDYGVLVMSSRVPRVYVFDTGVFDPDTVDYDMSDTSTNGAILNLPAQKTLVDVRTQATDTIVFVATDVNGNALPQGATVSAALSSSKAGSLVGATSFTIPSQTEYYMSSFTLRSPDADPADGTLFITVTAGGVSTIVQAIAVDAF